MSQQELSGNLQVPMRYPLLNFIVCPETRSPLVCLTIRERDGGVEHMPLTPSGRVNQPGSIVGPMPKSAPRNAITSMLAAYACEPFDDVRAYYVRVEQGVLIATDTGRWYPIRGYIPELLPDHLRDFDRDREWLSSIQSALPPDIVELLSRQTFPNVERRTEDTGLSYKVAEMTIEEKVTDQREFFGPGKLSPFNPGSTHHSIDLIRMFGLCMPLMHNGRRRIILDAGCGYCWTTDWMWKCGMEPIGIDISRVYLDVAHERLGNYLPHVLVGDTENLPLRDEVIDGVLGFDAFHHIPNRNRAMQEFFRVMTEDGLIVLAEPAAVHEQDPAVQEVMKKFGTLEKGMDLEDVQAYVKDTGLGDPIQHHVVNLTAADFGSAVSPDLLRQRSYNQANLFTIPKRQPEPPPVEAPPPKPSVFTRIAHAISGRGGHS